MNILISTHVSKVRATVYINSIWGWVEGETAHRCVHIYKCWHKNISRRMLKEYTYWLPLGRELCGLGTGMEGRKKNS